MVSVQKVKAQKPKFPIQPHQPKDDRVEEPTLSSTSPFSNQPTTRDACLFLEHAKDLLLEQIRKADRRGGRRLGLIALDLGDDVGVARAATASVVILIAAGAHGGLGNDVLVGAPGRRGSSVTNVGGTCF
jgi:hypothetical protein